jgi:hypothetical protein
VLPRVVANQKDDGIRLPDEEETQLDRTYDE